MNRLAGTALVALACAISAAASSVASTSSFVYRPGSEFSVSDDEWEALEVSTTERALPAGCKCVESGVESGCKFDCTCVCDLMPGQCDPNCCCDEDCTALEKAEFAKTHSFCHDATTAVLSVRKCMSTSSVLEVNPSYGIRLAESSESDGTAGFLCVVKDNNPTKGNFFSAVTTPQSDKVLEANGVAPEFSFRPSPLASLSSSAQQVLVPGDRLQAVFPSASDLTKDGLAAFGGFLPLPTAGPSGTCSEQNYVKFLHPIVENPCVRSLKSSASMSIADVCTTGFGHTSLVGDGNQLFVLKKFASSIEVHAPKPSGTSKYVPVELGSFQRLDMATGLLSDISRADPTWNATSKVCSGALISVHYRVTYTPYDTDEDAAEDAPTGTGGEVSRVVANIVVGDITAAEAPSGTNVLSVQQEYLVDFVTDTANISDSAKSTEVTRARSGNPGYERGRPVLSGTLVTNNAEGVEVSKSAIQQARDGLRMPFFADASGDCVVATEAAENAYWADRGAGEQILFGHDLIKSCVIRDVTKSMLKSMCESDPNTVSDGATSTYGTFLNSSSLTGTRIGVYGNANFTNTATSEWLEMKINVPAGAGRFSADQLICGGGGLVTSMDFEFLVAKSGAYLNPQSKIIAARVVFGREDVQFVASSKSSSSTMDIVLTSSVTFVHLGDEALEEYVPPAPPLLPEIPYDIFYPFLLSRGVPTAASGVSYSALMLMATVLLILCAGAQNN